ncbi:hypothetical protein ACS0TY_009356 [Phlomoides rotata]
MMKYTLLLSLIISSLFLQTRAAICLTRRFTVHITNNLPSAPLTVHCTSKDDDLGVQNLAINADYNFSFCVNPISTVFTCNFQWMNKNANFEVYKAAYHGRCNNAVCFYSIKTDGFYFSNSYPPGALEKVFSW